MIETMQIAGMIIVSMIAVLIMFALLVYFGFRLGRQSINKPLPPIINKQRAQAMVEEDPYWEPMNGAPKPSTPTVED